MKKIRIGLILLICVMMLFALSACGRKYCSVSGCPRYATSSSNYCASHKCSNHGCNNKATSGFPFGYCDKCSNN